MRGLWERDGELGALHAALAGAVAGDGSVVVVGGEAGIGKSSLLMAVRQRALAHRRALRTDNPHVIVTRGTKTGRAPASTAYFSHLLDAAGVSARVLRGTRLINLVNPIDAKLVAAAFGMDPKASCPTSRTQSIPAATRTPSAPSEPDTLCATVPVSRPGIMRFSH